MKCFSVFWDWFMGLKNITDIGIFANILLGYGPPESLQMYCFVGSGSQCPIPLCDMCRISWRKRVGGIEHRLERVLQKHLIFPRREVFQIPFNPFQCFGSKWFVYTGVRKSIITSNFFPWVSFLALLVVRKNYDSVLQSPFTEK